MSCGLQQGSQRCVLNKALCALGTILDLKDLSFKRQEAVSDIFQLQHKVIPQALGNSRTSQKGNEAKTTQKKKLFFSTYPIAQISIPISANMTPNEIWRLVDVKKIKRIHFGHVAIFSSTRLVIALVEFRPFTTMSKVNLKIWDELSQFLFCKRKFSDPISTNEELLERFMFAIGWRKCSTKNEKFGLYGSLGKIENTKYEWQNQGENLSLVVCILVQSLQYLGDKLFQKIKTCYKSLWVLSFDQVNYEANISENHRAFKFASTLTFTMNGFKNSPHLDKNASLYALRWWFLSG
ncbi:hypothetical protein O181_069241 [Austropuccinia psidii MF-1]|uniref:Tet-like 2OG-Fe(II) oxygenase domain-containing protein n=1 Tax=Austropuccinia psidii MF-1 TaxID=1389203 RepID=A0A9Q3I4M6_9BASI|nr:hypothetical protein [Austropuccinia psidii MF-1]